MCVCVYIVVLAGFETFLAASYFSSRFIFTPGARASGILGACVLYKCYIFVALCGSNEGTLWFRFVNDTLYET